MSEEGLEAESPLESVIASVEHSAELPAGQRAPQPTAKAPAKVNKLHEWGAAIVLMVLLAGILFGFLHFLRGVSF
jgi:hypothetical protein